MSGLPLILASGSPRRRELLRGLGVDFEVVTAGVAELDEAAAPGLAPAELAIANGRLKAGAVARLRPGRWILGADTVVALEGRIFGKPGSMAEARDFLRVLSGHTHEVVTGGVLRGPDGGEECFQEISRVTFQPLSEEVIARYLDAVHVLDKAGGYALQERGEWIVASVEGSRANVIGLPVEILSELLRARGLI
jgi:nucleoside triphosphate pyrophosphatase